MGKVIILLLSCILLFGSNATAQTVKTNDQKVGLALSGGGAKGIAHIALLKLIDSLQIKVDYITGTSMGSVVGGLYACGYTGKDIEYLVRHMDWNLILSNRVEFNSINVEEKDEFGKYLLELPSDKKLKPTLPLGIIEGQSLLEFLNRLTFHVHNINDFDSLPIPFRCMSADIISGEPVVLKSGYLPLAMRSSMAIPTVFTPIARDTLLLVDGGLVKNFPVDLCRDMGAEFVIGAYTGGKLYGKAELNSFIKLLYQSASFNRLEDSRRQKELCDVYVNSDAYLNDISAGDFGKFEEILRRGDSAAREVLPQLIALAASQKIKRTDTASILHKLDETDSILVTDIKVHSKDENDLMVKGKLEVFPGKNYSLEDLNKGIDNIYGSRFYERVYYNLQANEKGEALDIYAPPKSPALLKVAFHYDNQQSAGIILNYTVRNTLLNNSRALVTIDFSENPKGRFRYYKFISNSMKWWVSSEYFYERIILNTYQKGSLSDQYTDKYMRGNMRINYTLDKSAYLFSGFVLENDVIDPRINPFNRIGPNLVEFYRYRFNRASLQAGYYKNDLNKVFFPTKGIEVSAIGKFIFSTYARQTDLVTTSTTQDLITGKFRYLPLLKVQLNVKQYIPFGEDFTWINSYHFGSIIRSPSDVQRNIDLGYALTEYFFLGGYVPRPRDNMIPVFGFNEFEYGASQILGVQSGVQWNFLKNFYAKSLISFFAAGSNASDFFTNFYKVDFHFESVGTRKAVHELGYGLQLGMNTRIGPLIASVNSTVGSPKLRFFWGFGYRLQ